MQDSEQFLHVPSGSFRFPGGRPCHIRLVSSTDLGHVLPSDARTSVLVTGTSWSSRRRIHSRPVVSSPLGSDLVDPGPTLGFEP
ncbi:unnamed protein product [Pleuronectes platessa]|uniref:Uncharacterized protein n=1 Tax=Pleuronectes platessa TaxID=8262 RepID=A0A9N7ZE51_PLEPL|nr:unnamed protein product [Pleuronectes platessa]